MQCQYCVFSGRRFNFLWSCYIYSFSFLFEIFVFLNKQIKKNDDETPNELVFLLRALLVCSLVLDCLQCYGVGDKDPRSYALGTGILGATCIGVWDTWISPVNLGNADSFLGQH